MKLRRILSLTLVFSMLLSLIVINANASTTRTETVNGEEKTYSVWGGYKEYGGTDDISDHLEGKGTAEEPYLIQSAADLAYLAQEINDTYKTQAYHKDSGWYRKAYIVQTVDIDLAGHEWIPIGTDCDYGTFCGVYDGRGHEIINMQIDKVHGLSHGLFGYLGDSGNQVTLAEGEYCGITNLYLEGEITAANNRVGGLVGQIHNRNHTVEGTTAYITNVTCNVAIDLDGSGKGANTGEDVDNKYYFAGVVGISNFAVLENVVNMGDVTVTNCDSSHPIGGIIGRATRTILRDCINQGAVTLETNLLNTTWTPKEGSPKYEQALSGTLRAGGIVGQYIKIANDDYLTFENCINKGAVTAIENGDYERVHAGGILGSLTYLDSMKTTDDGTSYSNYNLTFTNCANTGTITAQRTGSKGGETNAGGILGTTYHGLGQAANNAGGITIQGCANTGTITSDPNADRAGGITGVIHLQDTHDLLIIENCISNTTITNFVTAPEDVKDAINQNNTVDDLSAAETLVTNNENLCMPSVTEICGFPTWGMAGLGNAESPYLIKNLKELKILANLVNGSEGDRVRRFENVYVKQTANITISGAWTPIGKDPACSFLGVYDGGDKTISGLSNFANGLSSIGLFGYIGNADGNTTLNYQCGIANLTVNGTISQNAQYVGGVVGKINHESYVADDNIAYIINTTSNVAINFSEYSSTADANWGGVVGYASSTIFQHVENKGTLSISGNINCGGNKISLGGIAGRAEHFDMVSCKNASTGDISFTTTSTAATGEIYIGGLVGLIYKKDLAQEQRFRECINEGDVSGTRYTDNWLFVGGIAGGPFWGMVDSSNPTFKYTDDQGNEVDTGVKYRDYNTRFAVCINSGAISVTISSDTDNNSSHMNAAGILGSTYLPGSQDKNNGGIKFEMCANKAWVTASNPTRAAGITQALYTTNNYNYGLRLKGCATSSNVGKGTDFIQGYSLGNQGDQEDGYDENGRGADETVTNLVQRAEAAYLLSGYNINGFPTGRQNPPTQNAYTSAFLMGTGTKKDPFVINNAADLRCLRDISNKGKGNTFEGSYIIQTDNIDLGGENWTPIAISSQNTFLGVYDGKGYTIKGLSITNAGGNASLGLFGYIGPSGSGNDNLDRDCGVANLTVEGSITVGAARVGGLVGQIGRRGYSIGKDSNSYKTYITNVTCKVEITVNEYSQTGDAIEGRHYFGGVAGFANGAVFENVVNEGNVTLTNCYSDHPAGGIVGRAATTEFISCTNKGDVRVSTDDVTVTTYDAADYYGIVRAGGIVGLYFKRADRSEWLTFTNCVNEGSVTAEHTSADAGADNRVHAGGILGSLRYPMATEKLPTYADTSYQYSPYDITFEGCINEGGVTAYNAGAGETNAGGIIGTLYDGFGGSAKNAGDITIKECANSGTISSTSIGATGRAAGIVGCVHNEGECDYGVKIIGCMTKAGLSGKSSEIAHKVSSGCRYDETDNGSDYFSDLYDWNTDLMAPSLENINGMPTAANVVVIRGLENKNLYLGKGETREIKTNEVIIDENGNKVEKLDKPGKYRYVLRYDGTRPYVGEVLHLYYLVTYDKAFTDEASISVQIQDDKLEEIFEIKIDGEDAKPLNTYTSYGKTGASTGGMIHVPRIFPQQFAELIYTTFSYGGKAVHTYEYSMWEYADRMLNERTHDQLGMDVAQKAAFDNLLVDLYKYAEEAQKLKWMKGPYATEFLTSAQKQMGSKINSREQVEGRIPNSLTIPDGFDFSIGTEPFIWRGAKLSFDHSVILRVEIKTAPENYKNGGYRIEATINGKPAECGFEDTYVYVKGFAPTLYDKEVVINIYEEGTNKNVAMTVHYSVNTYLYNRWNGDVAPLVQALARYGDSARKFVAAMENQ